MPISHPFELIVKILRVFSRINETVTLRHVVFEITFKANQTFGLTGSEISQSEPKLARPKMFLPLQGL